MWHQHQGAVHRITVKRRDSHSVDCIMMAASDVARSWLSRAGIVRSLAATAAAGAPASVARGRRRSRSSATGTWGSPA